MFPPLGELVGPRILGAAAAVASTALFARLATAHWGIGARAGVLWFAAATLTDLLIGRLTFALGVAVADGFWLAAAAFGPAVLVAVAFPEGGRQPFGGVAALAVVGTCAVAWRLVPADQRWLRAGAILNALGAAAAFVLPTPMGSNATRLLALFGPGRVALAAEFDAARLVGRGARCA